MSKSRDEPSPLSAHFTSVVTEDDLPDELPMDERRLLAQARVNSQIRDWRLVRLLGTGPIGAVYEAVRGAKDATERVALKVLVGHVGRHERGKSLFLRAAYAANRFRHGRVLPILEDGADADGIPYIVRPLVDAEPLADIIARGDRFSEVDVLRLGEQVLDALEMAHAHGMTHGALSPENILMTPRKSIRLCDFATPPGLGSRTASEIDLLAKCRIGPFTPPERCMVPPLPPTEQVDIYSLGACMYHALTGAFPRGSAVTAGELARTAAKPVRELVPELGAHAAAVIDLALGFDPVSRYDSAYAMLGDVRRVLGGRRPKLTEAAGPNPSQSKINIPMAPASTSRVHAAPTGEREPSGAGRLPQGVVPGRPRPPGRTRGEWRGNLVLVFAIAALVGVATFVLVKEKLSDPQDTPPVTADAGAKK